MADGVRLASLALSVVLVVGALASPVAAQTADTEPALVVELDEDGAADLTLRLTYDLDRESEQQAFDELRENDSAREEALSRFYDRMQRVANATEEAEGREMSVSDPAIDLSETDGGATGLVELSVTWTGLAADDDGRLVVDQPFADGFEPDRRLVVVGPEGYEPTAVEPSTDSRDGRTLEWAPETDVSGFTVAFADSSNEAATSTASTTAGDSTPASSDGRGPGFGVAAGAVALIAAALLARRRGA